MEFKIIEENKIKLFVQKIKIPTKKMEVFYNADMVFDRDISEAICSIFKPKKICDCMAASGARGLRYASELKESEVVLNDKNINSVNIIKKNAELNKLKVRIENEDANTILRKEKFDFIDIDPFGSPIYF